MPVYIIMIFVSFVFSLFGLLVKENRLILRFFPVFLFVTLLIEYYSWKLSESGKNNIIIYNFFTLAEFIFYLFFLKQVIAKFYRGVNISVIIIVYTVLAGINIFFIQGVKTFHTYTYLLGCLLIVIFCIIYFYHLFRSLRSDSLAKESSFWIITALLFFYACSLPILGITNFMTGIPSRYYKIMLFTLDFSNVLLYVLFTVGFICKINFRKLLR